MKNKLVSDIIMEFAAEAEQKVRDALILQGWIPPTVKKEDAYIQEVKSSVIFNPGSPEELHVSAKGVHIEYTPREVSFVPGGVATSGYIREIPVKKPLTPEAFKVDLGHETNLDPYRSSQTIDADHLEIKDHNGKVLMSTKAMFEPYIDMVARLFKKLPTKADECLHAAIGMMGEAVELFAADGRANIKEELGDLRFYFRAMPQKLGSIAEQINETREVLTSPYYSPSHATVMGNILIICGTMLDLCKKPWVYSSHPSKGQIKEYEIHQQLALLEINIDFYCAMMGFTWEEIEFGNQMKLIGTADQKGRYHSGEYSDEQANARADKS